MKLIFAVLFSLLDVAAFAGGGRGPVPKSSSRFEFRPGDAGAGCYKLKVSFDADHNPVIKYEMGYNNVTLADLDNDSEKGECADLHGMDLSHWHPKKAANFRGANLRFANLRGLKTRDVSSFFYANLSGTDLSGGMTRLAGVSFDHANLTGANLNGAHLEGVELSNSYLNRAQLRRTHLEKAVLIGADFSGADLTGAFLNGAALPAAHLRQCSRYSGVHWEGARYDRMTEFPFGIRDARGLGMIPWPIRASQSGPLRSRKP